MTQTAFAPALAIPFETVLNARYSCRSHLPDPVSRDTINEILRLAQRTPSWCNSQPWRVLPVDGFGRREDLYAAYEAEGVPNVAPPYRLSLTPVVDPVAAPTLGQHTREVLRSLLGLDDAALAELVLSGALGEPAHGAAQAAQE